MLHFSVIMSVPSDHIGRPYFSENRHPTAFDYVYQGMGLPKMPVYITQEIYTFIVHKHRKKYCKHVHVQY